jgi:transposase, IS5 family
VIRDIPRRIAGNETLEERFAGLFALTVRVRFQHHRQRGPKSTRCTLRRSNAWQEPTPAKAGAKPRAPYEFGCKVSVATPATKPKGGQFVLHAMALHTNPLDGHTLGRSSPSRRR